ncbi:MAG: zinc ABC transporter substrate-binding protein [Acidobacteria bacterium]|nr:zinc ABC transporter substrate-binding protein [Acidobacteriota bacterium]
MRARHARHAARALGAALALTLTAGACTGTPGGGGTLRVVASFYPLAEAARQVGGDLVTVSDLTPAGAEPHDLELRPSDLRRLRRADLVLSLGRGFQPAVEDAIASLPDRSRAVDLLAGLPIVDSDPHLWLDPALMGRIAGRIAGELARRLPSGRAAFDARAAAWRARLDPLDADYRRTLAVCERRDLFVTHASFGYLAARYDLNQVAIAGLSPEAEPSPRRLAEVSRLARERGATTIFYERLVSARVAQAVARAAGARTALLDPIEGLTREHRTAGDGFLSVMRRNLAAIGAALGCKGAA